MEFLKFIEEAETFPLVFIHSAFFGINFIFYTALFSFNDKIYFVLLLLRQICAQVSDVGQLVALVECKLCTVPVTS